MIEDQEHTLGRTCCYPGCGRQIHDHSPVEVCRTCGMKIALEFEADLGSLRRSQQARHFERTQAKQGNREGGLVYYVKIGDHIKIGYTTRLRERLRSLRVDPDAVMAVEYGPPELERQRHRDFRSSRLGRREDFEPTPELLNHIGWSMVKHGLPDWVKLPNTSAVKVTRALD